MPRIDPLKLLNCLKVLLAENGGIRSENEVIRIAGLMGKYSKKLVSKCIYVQILKCTKTELLGEFMSAQGWNLTHVWLSDSIRAMNWPLVHEILELLLLCPVDVQRLKSNTAPKLVKNLTREGGTEAVRILSSKLVDQWLHVVKSETPVQTSPSAQGVGASLPSATVPMAVTQSTAPSATVKVDQPQAVPSDPLADAQPAATSELTFAQKKAAESGPVYQIIVKDGKQILTKITSPTKLTTSSGEASAEMSECDGSKVAEDLPIEESSLKVEKNDEKDDLKEKKEHRDREKSKSSSSRDKERSKSSSSKSSSSSHKSSSKSSSSSSRSKSSSSSHRSSSDSKSRDKDKERSSSDKHKSSSSSSSKSSSSKDKDRHRSSKSSSSSSSSSKEKDKEREKIDQAEKDKDTLSKILPQSLDKLGKIPKKSKDDQAEAAAPAKPTPTSITIPSKKASMSIEYRRDSEKAKTVKTYKSQFRSHGLTEEAPPPPSRKGLKKPAATPSTGISIPSTLTLKRSSPPPGNRDSPTEKKPKIDMTTAAVEKPGAIKLIPPKPKPTLVETNLFSDALSAAMVPKKDGRKRKRNPSVSKDASKESNNTSTPPGSPDGHKVAPLKFYQDTLDDSKNEGSGDDSIVKEENPADSSAAATAEDDDDIPLKKVKEDIEEKVRKEMEKDDNTEDGGKKDEQEDSKEDDSEETEPPVPKPPGPGCGPNGPPGVLMCAIRRKGPKKKLTWKPQEQLEEVRFFELDETERVNVTKTFMDMKAMERVSERDAIIMSRKLGCEDIMTEKTAWRALLLVEDVPPHPEGSQSREKVIQAEREQTTLKALYFSRALIPDSPSEPDMEHYQMTEPAVIPIDDITGNPDAVNDFTAMPWPDPKGSPPQENFGANGMFPHSQFNPFMPFPSGAPANWQMGGPVMNSPQMGHMGPVPNGMMGPNGLMPPQMGNFNNMGPGNMGPGNMGPGMGPGGMGMMNGMPPNGPGPMMPGNMPGNMNMMGNGLPQFGPLGNGPPNFGPGGPGPNFGSNFGPPMEGSPQNGPMSPNDDWGRRGGPSRPGGGGRGGGGGNWRTGGEGNWRPAGPGNDRGDRNDRDERGRNDRNGRGRNWVLGGNNGRVCKQFMRGHCRLGNKCNFSHPKKF